MESTMREIERKYQDRTIILNLSDIDLTNHNFSIFNRNYTKNRYVLYDMFTYSLIPRYMAYQSRACDCDATDPVQFFRWLASDKAIYIADPFWFELTERYMRLVHGSI